MPSKNSAKQREIEYRRQCVKEVWVKLGTFNVTQAQIVDALKEDYEIEVDQSTVSRDLTAIKKVMQQQTPEELRSFLMGEYLFVIDEVRRAWALSLKDKETSTQEQTENGEGGERAKVQIRTEKQSGNPAHLAQLQSALRGIRDMFGVDMFNNRVEHTGIDGQPIEFVLVEKPE